MRYAQNNDVYESTTQCATDWSSINWYKVEKYVDKLQKRIYHEFCLSRMFGNGHVRFLRGCGRAIVQSYLTQQKHKKTNDNPISRKYRKKIIHSRKKSIPT